MPEVLPADKAVRDTCAVYDRCSAAYAAQYAQPSKTVDEFLALLPTEAVILEVGCGPGVDAYYFAQHGHRVIATDISPRMIHIAQQRFPALDFRVQDMRFLDFPRDAFDGIYAESSLIHIPKQDIRRTVQGLYRVLKPDGILAVGLQEGDSQETLRPAPFASEEAVFLNIMSHTEAKHLFATAGFRIIQDYRIMPRQQGQHPFVKRKLFAQKVLRPA